MYVYDYVSMSALLVVLEQPEQLAVRCVHCAPLGEPVALCAHRAILRYPNVLSTHTQNHSRLISRVTENSVSTIEFYRLFLIKSNGLC